jgi:hypothetical protein
MDESRGQEGTHANFPAVCFVTAAAMPPLSLACFLSFLEAGERVIVSLSDCYGKGKRALRKWFWGKKDDLME